MYFPLLPLEPPLLLLPEPPQHPLDSHIESVLYGLQPLLGSGIHYLRYIVDHFLSHFPHLLFTITLQHILDRRSVFDRVTVYENRVTLPFARQKPLVLVIRGSPPEENRDRTGQHAVEDRPSGEAVTPRLQTKLGTQKRFEDRRRAVRTPRLRAVYDRTRVRLIALSE
jgi:hypothetical protein